MTDKQHRAAILKVLSAFLEDRFPKLDPIPAKRRRRVQAVEGEILTSEESLARLMEEERVRALAPKRPRGRPKGSGAALDAPTDAVQSGPIDKYVSKTPPRRNQVNPPHRRNQVITSPHRRNQVIPSIPLPHRRT